MQNQIWVDYLRVWAVFSVVVIHVTSFAYNDFNEIPIKDWWVANILNGLSRFSVPMFVMISGYLLLGRDIGINAFYVRRAFRLIPAFVFWSIFFVIFDFFLNDRTISYSIWQLSFGFLVAGKTYFHLWYLSMFICLMLFAPFMNNYILGNKPTTGEYFYVIGLFAFFMFLNQGASVANEIFNQEIIWFKLFPWYMAYFISGYFIGNFHKKIKLSNLLAVASLMLLLSTSVVLNYYAATNEIVVDWFVLNNAGVINFAVTLLIFYLFAKNRGVFKYNKTISSVATASFGIYLTHPIFIRLFENLVIGTVNEVSIAIFILLSLTFTLSFFLVRILRKINVFRKVC